MNGDISLDLSLYIGVDVVPAALAKEVVAFAMRSKVDQERQGSNTVHVSRKSIVVRGVYVSIELTLHLVDRRIVLRLRRARLLLSRPTGRQFHSGCG